MRTGISITLKPANRRRLKALARDRNTPHKHVWRAEIVLLSADGVGTNEIMRRTGKSKTCVWRWQERFMQAGYDSLLHDKTRPSRIPPLGSNITERVVTLTQTDPPTEATHWTSAMMVYIGLAGSRTPRSLRKRLDELLKHASGLTTDRGPHKGGEIVWQLRDYHQFHLWAAQTDDPPIPREIEETLLRQFAEAHGTLPFANRQS